MEDELLEIGKVGKPHGVKGKVRIAYYGDSPEILTSSPYVILKKDDETYRFKVESVSAHKKYYIASFEAVASFHDVHALAGAKIFLPKKFLPPLDQDEHYWFELIGCRVITDDGTKVGIVSRIIATGNNDVYVVTHEKGEVLIPATVEVVKAIDAREKTIIVYSIEGRLDNDFI